MRVGSTFAIALLSGAAAQQTSVLCKPGYEWMSNSLGQNPCMVASYLQGACVDTVYNVLPLLSNESYYIGPQDPGVATECLCSTVTFSLMAACGACQGRDPAKEQRWSRWEFNCSLSIISIGQFLPSFSNLTQIPAWAYEHANLLETDLFSLKVARAIADSREPDIGPSGSINPAIFIKKPPKIDIIAGSIIASIISGGLIYYIFTRYRKLINYIKSRWLRRQVTYILLSILIILFTLVWTLPLSLKYLIASNVSGVPHVEAVEGQLPRNNGLFLYGGIQTWNIESKTLSLRFIPHFCGPAGSCLANLGFNDTSYFLNTDAFGIGGFDYTKSALNWTLALRNGDATYADQVMELEMLEYAYAGQSNLHGQESDVMYPFDWYKVRLVAAATVTGTNITLPMVGASIFNRISLQWTYTTNIAYIDDFLDHASKIQVEIIIHRTKTVLISAILIFLLNWLVTLMICYMVIIYILGLRQLPPGLDSIALPFTGLFALPTVRGIMPGNPPFGCVLDFIGIIPNLCIVAACASLLLIMRIKREAVSL